MSAFPFTDLVLPLWQIVTLPAFLPFWAVASKSYVMLALLTPTVSLSALPTKFVHAAPPHPAERRKPGPPEFTILAFGCPAM